VGRWLEGGGWNADGTISSLADCSPLQLMLNQPRANLALCLRACGAQGAKALTRIGRFLYDRGLPHVRLAWRGREHAGLRALLYAPTCTYSRRNVMPALPCLFAGGAAFCADAGAGAAFSLPLSALPWL